MATALLCTLLAIALRTGDAVGAEGEDCDPSCVILIQVDGLEPKDVNQQTTPYLWRLAHPREQDRPIPSPALAQRSGWIWQAPRGVVSTGTAPATASLLSGGFPEKTGVPSDDFWGPTADAPTSVIHQRLGAGGFGDRPGPEAGPDRAEPVSSLPIDTVPGLVNDGGGQSAIFLGDPGLASLVEATSEGNDPHWFPPGDDPSATYPEDQFTGDERLCPLPRYPDGGKPLGTQTQEEAEASYDPRRCPANDLTVANKAIADFKQAGSADVTFTFMHLAELGAAKRAVADPDVDSPPEADVRAPQPGQALADMDTAIMTFTEQYAQQFPQKWEKTVLMVVGTHGYQVTPLANRVPHPHRVPEDPTADPTGSLPAQDVAEYVAKFPGHEAGALTLIPQGTMATIHYGLDGKASSRGRSEALDDVKAALEGEVDDACAVLRPALGGCIEGVYYTDKDTPGTSDTVASRFKTWHLDTYQEDPLDRGKSVRTRASGDLVVVLKRGWAVGRAAGTPFQAGADGQPVTNAYTASSGGPQERAVAALVNGPALSEANNAVRNLDSLASSPIGPTEVKYFPVSEPDGDPVDPTDPDTPPVLPDEPPCPDTATDPGGLACANDPTDPPPTDDPDAPPWKVIDDAEAPGHERQPVTVDFAVTISALMQLPFAAHPDQLQGRVLQEAFINPLATPCVGDACDPPEVVQQEEPDPPPLPPPPVEVIQPKGFDFYGLVQKLKARVVDSRDRTYARAPRGSVLSTIRLEGDFGKPEAAVTLTF
ncbi:MAG TPA: alkaline phosphatase family protein, partial [Solirubrobacteraceae bacterium]|nr:alkaline phosphatase family protein [Solirubrobacteraceae bacterium]